MDKVQNAMRLWLADIAKCVKLNYYTKDAGISNSNLSNFLHGDNGAVSYQKLCALRDLIIADLTKKIA